MTLVRVIAVPELGGSLDSCKEFHPFSSWCLSGELHLQQQTSIFPRDDKYKANATSLGLCQISALAHFQGNTRQG